MIKIENIEVMGFRAALRGMRNPRNSWDRSDTVFDEHGNIVKLGPNDAKLMLQLKKAGTDHRKYLRMVHVQADVTAPLYWWKDYDTYKVATVANSCSSIYYIKEIGYDKDLFSHEYLDDEGMEILQMTIDYINKNRAIFNETKDMSIYRRIHQMTLASFMQKRTIDLNYETLLAIFNSRDNHPLWEFHDFNEILKTELPYIAKLFYNLVPDDDKYIGDGLYKIKRKPEHQDKEYLKDIAP